MQSTPETLPLFPGLVPPASRNVDEKALDEKGLGGKGLGGKSPGGKRVPEIRTEDTPDDLPETIPVAEPQLTLLQSPTLAAADPGDHKADPHMAIAWRLSKAMKGVKSGHREARNLRRMTPRQRHQVGNVICGHLLASLRAQVAAESRSPALNAQAN